MAAQRGPSRGPTRPRPRWAGGADIVAGCVTWTTEDVKGHPVIFWLVYTMRGPPVM